MEEPVGFLVEYKEYIFKSPGRFSKLQSKR